MPEFGFTFHTEINGNPKSMINNNDFLKLKKAIMNYKVHTENNSNKINLKKNTPITKVYYSHDKPFSLTFSNLSKKTFYSGIKNKILKIKLKKPKSFDTNRLVLSGDEKNNNFYSTREVIRNQFSAIKIGDRIELIKDKLYETVPTQSMNALSSLNLEKEKYKSLGSNEILIKNNFLKNFMSKRKIKLSTLLPIDEVHKYLEDRKKEMEIAIKKGVNARASINRNLLLEELESMDNNMNVNKLKKKSLGNSSSKVTLFTKKSSFFPFINTKSII
jgi:hypothetical protein